MKPHKFHGRFAPVTDAMCLEHRMCRRSDGAPKRWYETRSAAKAAAKKHQHVYPCPSGEGFHIASGPR